MTKAYKTSIMGLETDVWEGEKCVAQVYDFEDHATIIYIQSEEKLKGYGSKLIQEIKNYYKKPIWCCPLNDVMLHLCKKFDLIVFE